MTPLIQSFSKNLSPCSGCGNNGVDYFVEQKQKGEPVKFILQVEVNTEGENDDLFSVVNTDRAKWKVISGNPARTVPQAGVIQGSQFQRTTMQPTPQVKNG